MTSPGTVDRIVDALVSEQLIVPGSADRAHGVVARVLDAPAAARSTVSSGMAKVVEVVAYLGAALVLAAGALFVSQSWADLGESGQVIALLVVTAVLGVAGLAVSTAEGGVAQLRTHAVRRRLAGTLLTGAALALACATAIIVDNPSDRDFSGVDWPTVAGSLVLLVAAAFAYRWAPTALGLVAMLGAALTGVVAAVSGAVDDREGLVVGLAIFLLAVVWLLVAEAGLFRETTTARALGAAVALVGAQVVVVADEPAGLGYLLTALVAGAAVWLYLGRVDWPYLAVAVAAVTIVVPEVVSDWTDDSLGGPGAVLLTGLTLLAASFAGYRLREEATD